MLQRKLKRTGLLFLTICLLTSFVFWGSGDVHDYTVDPSFTESTNQLNEKEMSAITLSSLPFILVVKYLMPDTDE